MRRKTEIKLTKIATKFHAGVCAFNNKKMDIFSKYNFQWTPLFYAAARLNPSIQLKTILTTSEIEKGDELILSKLHFYDSEEKNQIIIQENDEDENFGFHAPNSQNEPEKIFDEYKLIQEDKNIDLYEFWKKLNNGKFSSLSKVAIEILSVLVTSASSEREFSVAKRILGYRRLSMTQDHVEDLSIIVTNNEISKKFIK